MMGDGRQRATHQWILFITGSSTLRRRESKQNW